jgi:hypothetical protein
VVFAKAQAGLAVGVFNPDLVGVRGAGAQGQQGGGKVGAAGCETHGVFPLGAVENQKCYKNNSCLLLFIKRLNHISLKMLV